MPELQVFEALHSLAGRSGFLDFLIVFAGSYLPYILFIAAIWFVIRQKDWHLRFYSSAVLALAALVSRGILTETIRYFFFRPRPFAAMNFEPLINHAANASLPSGHAALYFALAFAIFLLNKKWGAWFTVFTAVAGLARVMAGAHWPLDIVAGALTGLIAFFVVKWLLPRSLINR